MVYCCRLDVRLSSYDDDLLDSPYTAITAITAMDHGMVCIADDESRLLHSLLHAFPRAHARTRTRTTPPLPPPSFLVKACFTVSAALKEIRLAGGVSIK